MILKKKKQSLGNFRLESVFFSLFYFLNYENMIKKNTYRRLGKCRTKLHIVPLYITINFLSR